MKILCCFLFMLTVCIGHTIEDWSTYESIVKARSSNSAELSKKITVSYTDDLDKIKAIYYWITHNIKYDFDALQELRYGKKNSRQKFTYEQLQSKLDKEVSDALKKRKGVCQQYSLIFQALCRHANIEAELIGGSVRSLMSKSKSKTGGYPHAWNAVKYKGQWRLIDATFGTGYVNEKQKFIFKFDPNFFFVDENAFVMNHLPREDKWQLLETPISTEKFKLFPNIGSGYIQYGISDLHPLIPSIKI